MPVSANKRTPPSKGKLLYHITHLDNISSILEHGLMSRCALLQNNLCDFKDIADPEILNKRETYNANQELKIREKSAAAIRPKR